MSKPIMLGHGGAINPEQVLAIGRAGSAPIKRLLKEAGQGKVLNLTYGYPRQSVILLNNGYLAIVSLTVEDILETLYPGIGVF